MSSINCNNVPVDQIDDSMMRSMFQLFSRYYADVSFDAFRNDLAEKDECIVLSTKLCADGHSQNTPERHEIVGFTTLVRARDPGPFGASYLFSGDTVLDKRAWGRRLLERAFFWTMLREKLRAPWRPLHWMLISKGFVTYLMMVRNFPSSFPRFDRPLPEHLRDRLDRYYAQRYGDRYHSRSGLVRSTGPAGTVAGRLAVPKGAMLDDPDVRYFVERNPGYGHGDELACIAEIRWRDFALHFATAFQRRRNRRSRVQRVDRRRSPRRTVPATDSH